MPSNRSNRPLVTTRPTPTALVRPDATLAPSHLIERPGSSFANGEVELHLRELCEATRMTPEGPVPDWATRTKGLQLLLAYREGLPLPRTVELPKPRNSDADANHRLKSSPGYRKALREYLDYLDGEEAQDIQETGDDACDPV